MPFSPDNCDIPAELSGEILDDAEAEAFDGVAGKQEATAIVGDPLNSNRSLPDEPIEIVAFYWSYVLGTVSGIGPLVIYQRTGKRPCVPLKAPYAFVLGG